MNFFSIAFCKYPGSIANGKVLLVGNMGLYDYRNYVTKVANNRQITFDCDKGYVLSSDGPLGKTCIHGEWSPKADPPSWDFNDDYQGLYNYVIYSSIFADAYRVNTQIFVGFVGNGVLSKQAVEVLFETKPWAEAELPELAEADQGARNFRMEMMTTIPVKELLSKINFNYYFSNICNFSSIGMRGLGWGSIHSVWSHSIWRPIKQFLFCWNFIKGELHWGIRSQFTKRYCQMCPWKLETSPTTMWRT